MSFLPRLFTALITPFTTENRLDEESFFKLMSLQKQAGVQGLLACGTTAESYALSFQEKQRIIDWVTSFARAEQMHACVNVSANNTQAAVELATHAKQAGADSLLMLPPFYVKTTPSGMQHHFKAVAQASGLPIIVYHHPGRTGVHLNLEMLKKLSEIPEVAGIKEAFSDIIACQTLTEQIPSWRVYAGDDVLTLPVMLMGGFGAISVVSNLFPKVMLALIGAMQEGDIKAAKAIHQKMLPVFQALTLEPNPAVIKALVAELLSTQPNTRMPLMPLSNNSVLELEQLQKSGAWQELVEYERGEGVYV